MKVIGINGSPRKQWNTATLVAKALERAAAQGASTELFHLGRVPGTGEFRGQYIHLWASFGDSILRVSGTVYSSLTFPSPLLWF